MATGLVTDQRFDRHTLPDHPESAERLQAVRRLLAAEHLTERCVALDAEMVSQDILRSVHTPHYLDWLAQTAQESETVMAGLDTYITPASYAIACLAAGSTCRAVEAVLRGEVANAVALVRPPGHHATAFQAMGFCLINNAAVAARYAQRVHGLERVLIVDYDVHHGNGTQEIFYADPAVLYISTHQSPLYPGTGAVHETGRAEGTGYTLNVPLAPGVGDQGYRRVFHEIVLPAARRFRPELVCVSAGFDAHWADPLAQMGLTLAGYDHLTRLLITSADQLCAGRIVFIMEGGYDLQVLSRAWANVLRALLGERESDTVEGRAPGGEPSVEQVIQRVRQLHKLT